MGWKGTFGKGGVLTCAEKRLEGMGHVPVTNRSSSLSAAIAIGYSIYLSVFTVCFNQHRIILTVSVY